MENDRGYYLRSCLWELTLKCNMHCMHCGSAAGRARKDELTLDECFAVADELSALGCAELGFIGGEIFLYKGWEKIARSASDRGMLVNVMTNGYGIRDEEIRQLQHARVANVGISVDGLEENHNRIRGKKDGFTRIIECFERLNREGISIAVVTSLMEMNFPDLEPLYAIFADAGVEMWQLQLVNPMGNMTGRSDLILRREKIPWLIEFIRRKNKERRMLLVAADSIGYNYADTEQWIRGRRKPVCVWESCQAGLSAMFIDSVGNVKGCGALYDDVFIEGNVRQRRLADIWLDESRFAYNRRFHPDMLTGGCKDCHAGRSCRAGCRASNYFTSGVLYENAYCPHADPIGTHAAQQPFVIV